jgi:Gpi18-like mannosyltransferase
MKNFKLILLLFVLWRVILFTFLYAGNHIIPYREGYSYTNIGYYIEAKSFLNHPLISPWANFDGIHYLSIASNGYAETNARFFPLFPILIYLISIVFGHGQTSGVFHFFTGLFLANICFLLSLFVFYKLVRLDFSHKTAINSIIFLLFFPTSFYFGSIYSESIYLLLTLIVFYLARKNKWLAASIFGAFLTAARIIGIAIFPVLAFMFLAENRNLFYLKRPIIKSIKFLIQGTPLLFIPLGILSYSYYNFIKWKDPLFFLSAHAEVANNRIANSVIFPLQTVFRYVKILTTIPFQQYEWWVAFLEITLFSIGVVLLYIGYKKGMNFAYILYAALGLLIPSLTGTLTGFPRYELVLFPLFITIALIDKKWLRQVYFAICIPLLFVLLILFSKGYFVA